MTRRHAAVLAALTCLALLGGCSDDPGSGTDGDPGTTWPTTDRPVDADGLVWAAGSVVHLPDGSTIDTGDLAGSYVVAGSGVWFASSEPGELEPGRLPELRLATADGVEDTGAHPGIGSLTATSDGRWLAFIDRLDGGGGRAEAVVVDLTTGEEVVRSDQGLVPDDATGDAGADEDWYDLYEDAPVTVLGVVDDTAYVRGLSDVVAHDLATGEVRQLQLSGTELADQEWFRTLHPQAPLWNDDRSWRILPQGFSDPVTVLGSADGERVESTSAEADQWALGGWLDTTTAVGITPAGGGTDWTNPALITCTVPDGTCSLVEGTEDGVTLPVDRDFGLPRERELDPT